MALPSNGTISIGDISTELGRSGSTISINDDDVLGLLQHYEQINTGLTSGNFFWKSTSSHNVAINDEGTLAFVAANKDDQDTGAILVYEKNNGIWQLSQTIIPADATPNSDLATSSISVSGSGNTLLFSSSTGTYIYTKADNTFVFTQKIGTTSVYSTICTDESTILISKSVYVKNGSTWILQATINQSDYSSIAISGDGSTIAFGYIGDNDLHPEAGAVYIYVKSASSWSLQQKVLPTLSTPQDLWFGGSVSLSYTGDICAVGHYQYGGLSETRVIQGSVYILARTGGSWAPLQRLVPPLSAIGYGYSTRISGDGSVVTATSVDERNSCIDVYKKNGPLWELFSQHRAKSVFDMPRFNIYLPSSASALVFKSVDSSTNELNVFLVKNIKVDPASTRSLSDFYSAGFGFTTPAGTDIRNVVSGEVGQSYIVIGSNGILLSDGSTNDGYWFYPSISGVGVGYECRIFIQSMSIGATCSIYPNSNPPTTPISTQVGTFSPWFTLTDTVIIRGSKTTTESVEINGSIYIRNKATLQEIQKSFYIKVNATPFWF